MQDLFEELIFMVQPYVAKPHRLVAQPVQVFSEAAAARRAGARLARYRAGVVVLAQPVERGTALSGRPRVLAVHGRIPDGWAKTARAA